MPSGRNGTKPPKITAVTMSRDSMTSPRERAGIGIAGPHSAVKALGPLRARARPAAPDGLFGRAAGGRLPPAGMPASGSPVNSPDPDVV
jgi:hypothetical protein